MKLLNDILAFLLQLTRMTPEERGQPIVQEAAQMYADRLETYLDHPEILENEDDDDE